MKIKHLSLLLLTSVFFSLDAQAEKIARSLQAAQVARNSHQERLESRAEKEGSTDIGKYVLDIENYDIGISENDREFVIYISLRKNKMGLLPTGGTYWIDKKTLKIENAVGFK